MAVINNAQQKAPETAAVSQPTADPRPWWRGSGGVATTVTRAEMARRARAILESDEYEQSLMRRIKSDTLPPAVETMLYAYGYGKPIEQIELTVREGDQDLSTLSNEELDARLKRVHDKIAQAKAVRDAIPATIVKGTW